MFQEKNPASPGHKRARAPRKQLVAAKTNAGTAHHHRIVVLFWACWSSARIEQAPSHQSQEGMPRSSGRFENVA
eukprot:3236725-Rhodomonas_salina.1